MLANCFQIILDRVVAKTIQKKKFKLRIQLVVLCKKTQEQMLSSSIVLFLERWILAPWLASLWFESAEGCRIPRYRHTDVSSFISSFIIFFISKALTKRSSKACTYSAHNVKTGLWKFCWIESRSLHHWLTSLTTSCR